MTNLTYSHPRTYGKDSRHCRVCHTTRGLIRKYGLNMCRRCFRERANQIGFAKIQSFHLWKPIPRIRLFVFSNFQRNEKKEVLCGVPFRLRGTQGAVRELKSAIRIRVPDAISTRLHSDAVLRMRAPRPCTRRGVGGACALLTLVVLLLTATMAATMALAGDASTVLYVYDDDHDAPAALQYVGTSRERDRVDETTLQSLQYNGDDVFLAVDRLGGDDSGNSPDEITVRIGGRGRRRSDGVSILRANGQSESDVVIFTPPQLDVSWVESCLPTMHNVRAENRGKSALRIDGVRFDHDAFSLASDPRGIVLEPSQSVQISVFFVSSQPEQLDAFMFLQTSQGEVALPLRGHTQPSPHGLAGLRVSVPVGARLEHTIRFHNPRDQVIRISEAFSLDGIGDIVLPNQERSTSSSPSLRSMWEVESQSTKSVARFVFNANRPPGRYQSTVQIVVPPTTQFVVPIQIDVRENQFLIEPNEIDVGVFVNDRERRDVSLTFHNMESRPVAIHGLRIIESDGMDISAELLGSPVIPPRSRVQRAVVLKSRSVNNSSRPEVQRRSGPCRMLLQFETNTSTSDNFHSVHVRGFSTRGHLSYLLSETTTRIVGAPSTNTEQEASASDPTEPAVEVVMAGSSVIRELVLTNSFDTALELETVVFNPSCLDATVETFTPGMAASASPFPTISLLVRPDPAIHAHTRACSLQVQTNASIHTIPIVFYTGIVGVKASRPVTEGPDATLPPCGSVKSSNEDHKAEPSPVKSCRQVVLELGKVGVDGSLEEVVNITNTSPAELHVSMQSTVRDRAVFQGHTTVSFHPDPHLPVELAALGVAWQQSTTTRKRDAHADTIAPGEVLRVKVVIWFDNQRTRKFVEPVAVIETQFEMIQLLIRFETVEGMIAPDVRRIDIQHIHPGRLGYVRVPFTSTFEHDVPTRGTYLMHSAKTPGGEPQRAVFAVWRLPKVLPANTTSYVTLMYFPAEYYVACRRGRFYADCFAPSATASPSSSPDFSGYSGLVTASDIERLDKRELQWDGERQRSERGYERRVGVDVVVLTDALSTNFVRVSTVIARPRFFRNDMSVSGVNFPLTELLQQVAAYVNVFNPSDYAMDMELAIAEHDRHLFYECDDDMTEYECLHEWQDIARERVEMGKRSRNGSTAQKLDATPFAPLFFKPRTVRVVGQGHTQLGPIFFFPSSVGDWKTRLFVRNELTHIEPFALAARSGLGELTITLRADEMSVAAELSNGGEIRFATSEVRNVSDTNETALSFGSTKTLVIVNTGTFQTALNSIRLFDVDVNKNTKAFAFTADGAVDSSGQRLRFWAIQDFILQPQEELRFEIEFTTDCFRSRRETEMQITTRDGVTAHRLVGLLTVDASFQCRRQFWTERKLQLTHWLWVAGASLGSVAVLLAVWSMVRGGHKQRKIQLSSGTSNNQRVKAQSDNFAEEVTKTGAVELMEQLTQMEKASLEAPPQPRIVTPAVAKLHASRQRNNAKLPHDDKPVPNGTVLTPAIVTVVDGESAMAETVKRSTPKAKKHAKSKSRSPRVERAAEVNRPNKASEELKVSPIPNNQQSDEAEEHVPAQPMAGPVQLVSVVQPTVEELMKESSENDIKDSTQDIEVESDEDQSTREETASEESDDQHDESVSVAVVEVAGLKVPPIERPSNHEEEDDGVVLVGMHDVDAFTMPLAPLVSGENDLLKPHGDERRDSLGFDDDWNALAFDSLQSEIGRLFGADDGPFDASESTPATESEAIFPVAEANGRLGSLNSLSMAPPLLPMSSLFGSTVPSLLPPPPRTRTTRAAPPGFSPEDANPEASRAAFGRLLQPTPPTLEAFAPPATDASASMQSAFSGRYSLFGPHVTHASGSASLFHTTPSALPAAPVGRIGANRGARNAPALGLGSGLASLGGVELSADDAVVRSVTDQEH